MTNFTINDYMYFNSKIGAYRVVNSLPHTSDADITYTGYMDQGGNWYIMESHDTNGTYKFIKGASLYSTNWTGREGLAYDTFENTFK